MGKVMEVGAFEAKTRFSELIDLVSGGREILVTKRGAPMARIVPVVDRKVAISRLLGEFAIVRAGAKAGPGIRELKEEGRR